MYARVVSSRREGRDVASSSHHRDDDDVIGCSSAERRRCTQTPRRDAQQQRHSAACAAPSSTRACRRTHRDIAARVAPFLQTLTHRDTAARRRAIPPTPHTSRHRGAPSCHSSKPPTHRDTPRRAVVPFLQTLTQTDTPRRAVAPFLQTPNLKPDQPSNRPSPSPGAARWAHARRAREVKLALSYPPSLGMNFHEVSVRSS